MATSGAAGGGPQDGGDILRHFHGKSFRGRQAAVSSACARLRRRRSTGSRKSETGRRDTSRSFLRALRSAGGSARLSQPPQAYGFAGDGTRTSTLFGGPCLITGRSATASRAAIVMSREAVYLAFMKSMRDPLSESRLADIIDQARGKGPADLVIKSVGIFDLTSGEMTVGDIAIAGDRIVGTYETYSGATEIDGRGLVAVPGFIDSHVHCEIDPGAAAGIRPLRHAARHHDGDLRSARDLQRAGRPRAALLPEMRRGHGHGPPRAALLLRAGDPPRDLGRAAGSQGPAALQAPIPRCSGWPR